MHAQQDPDKTTATTLSLLSTHPPAAARAPDPQHSGAAARAVVSTQLPVLQWLTDHRRATSGILAAAAWAATCAAVIVGSHLGRDGAAQIALAATMVIYALGESLLSPALPVIVDDPAPPGVAGRYNRLGTLAFTIGCMLGPAVGVAALGAGWDTSLLTTLAVACALASIAAHGLGRHRQLTSAPAVCSPWVDSSHHGRPERPHKIATSPDPGGVPHNNPMDETALSGTRRHGCYPGR